MLMPSSLVLMYSQLDALLLVQLLFLLLPLLLLHLLLLLLLLQLLALLLHLLLPLLLLHQDASRRLTVSAAESLLTLYARWQLQSVCQCLSVWLYLELCAIQPPEMLPQLSATLSQSPNATLSSDRSLRQSAMPNLSLSAELSLSRFLLPHLWNNVTLLQEKYVTQFIRRLLTNTAQSTNLLLPIPMVTQRRFSVLLLS